MTSSSDHVGDLPAGDFSSWLRSIQAALRGDEDSDVPCDGCTACCTSSQFVHIGPDETDTLAHIPPVLLFPAPLLPRGHVVMGYDSRGHCPMLVDGACSIYAHRPRTCRTYDCRIFAATSTAPDDDKPLIAARVRRWRFGHPAHIDQIEHDAVAAAATFIAEHDDVLPADIRPATATQLAVLAIEAHGAFAQGDPDPEAVRVVLSRHRISTQMNE